MIIFKSATWILLLFLPAFFMGCSSLQKTSVSSANSYYIANCKILNNTLEDVRILTGNTCLPLADGGWIGFTEKSLTRYSPYGEAIWSKPGFYHHQIKLSSDLYIFVLSAHVKMHDKKNVKYDTVLKFDLDGNLIAKFDLYHEMYISKTLVNSIFHNPPWVDKTIERYFPGTHYEQQHLNAINFYQDDIIVNSAGLIVIILDKNLKFKQLLREYINFYFTWCPEDKCSRVQHDYQKFTDGSNLIFKNINASIDTKGTTFKIFEFKNNKIIFEFPLKKEDEVENDFCGGVQKLSDDTYLVGFPLKGENASIIGLISKDKGWILKKQISQSVQEIKLIPYSDFMKLNKIR